MHYEETVKEKSMMPLDFKWDIHLNLEANGVLKVLTARSHKSLAGYVFWIVTPNLVFNIKTGTTTLFFMDPLYRPGGKRLIDESEPALKDMGARQLMVGFPFNEDSEGLGPTLETSGYKPFESVYSKFL